MSDRISPEAVAKVAKLARLSLTPDELERASHELGDMLEHFADIDALDLDDVEPMTQPYPLANVLRDDVVAPGLDRDEVLAAAPAAEDGPLPGAADHRAGGLTWPIDAIDIAAARPRRRAERRRRASSEHLAAIAAREAEIHAFNLVTRRRGPRPARPPSTRSSPPAATRARSPACRSR